MKSSFENTQNPYLSQMSQSSQAYNDNSQQIGYSEYFNSQDNNFVSQINNINGNYGNDIDQDFLKSKYKANNIPSEKDYQAVSHKSTVKKESLVQIYPQEEESCIPKDNIHQEVDYFYAAYNNNMLNLRTTLLSAYDNLEDQSVKIIKHHKNLFLDKLTQIDRIISLEVKKIKESNENVIVVNEKINFLFKQLLEVIKVLNN